MSTGSVDIVITDIDDKLNGLPHTTSNPSIPRIHSHYRSVGSDTIYDPEILSIGPYHHGNPRFQNMEQVKYVYLKRVLIRRNELSVDRYVTAVAAMEKQARQCYAGPIINLDENKFVTLLVVDGIFVIEFLRCFHFQNLRDPDDSIFNHEGTLILLLHDIRLLENQVPMFILKQLFNMTKTNENGVPDDDDHLVKLAFRFFKVFPYRSFPEPPFRYVPKIDHLCGLIHAGWCVPFVQTLPAPSKIDWEHINSASRLREAGIKFQAAYGSLLDIKIVNGVLMIPKLSVHDGRESELRNLIVYEQYLPGGIQKCFSDYSFFIYCLIKTSDDVDLLRSHGIILNFLGHDEEVCWMFNRLGKYVQLSDDFCYSQVFRSLNIHCGHRRNRWKANLRKNYFNSPWSIISFVAAALLLILTLAQTLYTILGYYYR